jgi:hypothetical protein
MLTLIRSPLAVVNYAAGKAPLVDLLRGVKTHRLAMHLQGNVVVASGGAGNVTAEAYQNIFSEIRMLEGGNPNFDLSGPMLGYLTNRNRRQAAIWSGLPSAGSALAAGTYAIAADFTIDFANPTNAAGDPSETVLMDVLANVKTQLEVTWNINGTGIGTATPTAVTLSGLTVQATQLYDASQGTAPYFLPRVFRGTSSGSFSSAQSKFPVNIYPQGTNRVQGVIFRGVTAGLTDSTVWQMTGTFNFRGDRTKYYDSVQFYEAFDEFGQQFFQPAEASPSGYLDLNFRKYGKVSECYIGGQDQNPRLEADVTSSGTSTIEWYTLELETVSGVTAPLPSGKS